MATTASIRKVSPPSAKPPKRSLRSKEARARITSRDPHTVRLRELLVYLHYVSAAVRVAAAALRAQNCECDRDVETLLLHHVLGPLSDQIDETEAVLQGKKYRRTK